MIHLSQTIYLDATEHRGGCSKGLFFLFVGNPGPAGSRRVAPWQPYLRLAGKSIFCRSWLFSGKSRPGHLCPFQEQLWLQSKPDKQCGPARGPLNRNERWGSFICFAHIQSSKWQRHFVPRKSFSESLGTVRLLALCRLAVMLVFSVFQDLREPEVVRSVWLLSKKVLSFSHWDA